QTDGDVLLMNAAGGSNPCNGTPTVVGTAPLHGKRVSVGWNVACAIGLDDRVSCWGSDPHDSTPHPEPALVPSLGAVTDFTLGLDNVACAVVGGKVWCWNAASQSPSPVLVAGLDDIVEVARASSALFARDKSGLVWASGDNTTGQLGHPPGTAG